MKTYLTGQHVPHKKYTTNISIHFQKVQITDNRLFVATVMNFQLRVFENMMLRRIFDPRGMK
jgi:hypothetical protein